MGSGVGGSQKACAQAPNISLPSDAASKRAGLPLGLGQQLTEEYPMVVPSIELLCNQGHRMLSVTCNASEYVCWRRLREDDLVDPWPAGALLTRIALEFPSPINSDMSAVNETFSDTETASQTSNSSSIHPPGQLSKPMAWLR